MRARIARWRRRQRSHILFIAVPTNGATIVPSGLVAARRLRMIEVRR